MKKQDLAVGAAVAAVRRHGNRPYVSPLRYPGGKRRLAPIIADLVTRGGARPSLFIEPFAGGASVSISMLEADCVDAIALADADRLVAAFWRVVFSPEAEALADKVFHSKPTLEEWKRHKTSEPASVLDDAFKCIFLNRTSFSGSLHRHAGPIGGLSQKGRYKIDSRFNREKLARRIVELSSLRERVRFVRCEGYSETMAAIAALGHAGSASVLWYLDPPFFAKADTLYRRSFAPEDHNALAGAIATMPGNWVLSYDDHPQARSLYRTHPGCALVNLRYTARIGTERPPAKELLVSDLIARLRTEGSLPEACEPIGSQGPSGFRADDADARESAAA